MIRRTLGRILTRIGKLLTGKPDDYHHSPTEQWLRKVKKEFKKKRLINPPNSRLDLRFNPLANDEDINCPCHYGGPPCVLHPDPSEELAFLEWMESKGIKLPKNDILKNDDRWRSAGKISMTFNPLESEEDFFIPQRNVA